MSDDGEDEDSEMEGSTPAWSCAVVVFVLANMFWWFVFAKPFLAMFEKLVAGIDRISPP
jgi:hypothetical protein